MTDPLRHHGDAEVRDCDLLDFAVNVRLAGPPAWLAQRIAAAPLGSYPDDRAAVAAVAARHNRLPSDVLPTVGAAEAFVLLARALSPKRAVCVHPSFTEPEAALWAAGHPVERVFLPEPYSLDTDLVPEDADLVVIGNPTNPTGVLHSADLVASLCRVGRTVVVDEAFMDFVPGDEASLSGRGDLPGLVVVRSLTKMWGLAGLRVGYALAPADVIDKLRAAQPLWPVSTPALAALEACSTPEAVRDANDAALATALERERLAAGLAALGLVVGPGARANFLLVRGADALRETLRTRGVAVRRCDTFPGLGGGWIRVAVRDGATNARLLATLGALARSERDPASV
ncbi:MAG: threonine-phosphate decarboxylase [Frankiales bacterium]|nr:threonine-phosphate decarboxylase [Frankiales bacterium]